MRIGINYKSRYRNLHARFRACGSAQGIQNAMGTVIEEGKGDPAGREGIRQVLLGQYMFHEAPHHPAPEAGAAQNIPTVPKAHTLADIYKCLHQGEFGVGHIITDPNTFAGLLQRDMAADEPNAAEPILENVSRSGAVFRVNLRPLRHRFVGREKIACALLAEACIRSATVHTGSGKDFIAALQWFKELNNSGELAIHGRSYAFPEDVVNLFLDQAKGFIWTSGSIPVLGHSPIYKQYNSPSYRVVDRMTLEHSQLAALFQETQ